MELHQLRYLVEIVDSGTFSAAAARLHVSQSGVSAQLAKLERELGQSLLERSRSGAVPTAAGEAVLPWARAALQAVEAIDQLSHDLAELLRGRVRMGLLAGFATPSFLHGLAAFRRRFPGVELEFTEGESSELAEAVRDGRLDLAILGFAGPPPADLVSLPFIDEPVAAVCADRHRLAGRGSVTLAELAAEQLLTLPPGTGQRTAFELSCERAGLTPAPALSARSPELLIGLAEQDAGVAVLTASMVDRAGLVAVPISDATVHAGVALTVRPGDRPRATAELWRTLAAELRPSTR